MTNGGPADSTTTVTFMMVRVGFREQNIAYASAIAVTFFLIILAINLIQRRFLREEGLTWRFNLQLNSDANADRRRRLLRQTLTTLGQYVLLVLLTGIFIFPLVFMIVSSFKASNTQIFDDLRSLRAFLPVGEITLKNYVSVFANSKFRASCSIPSVFRRP